MQSTTDDLLYDPVGLALKYGLDDDSDGSTTSQQQIGQNLQTVIHRTGRIYHDAIADRPLAFFSIGRVLLHTIFVRSKDMYFYVTSTISSYLVLALFLYCCPGSLRRVVGR